MDKFQCSNSDLIRWENLYNSKLDQLPWVYADIPLDPLKEFFNLLSGRKRVLDFGCGNGRIAEILDQWGASVIGADCSETAIANARPLENGSYIKASSLNDFKSENFNGVILWGILHHYPPQTWLAWLESAKRILLSSGIILLGGFDCTDIGFKNTPVRTSPTTGVNAYCLHNKLVEMVLQNLGFETLVNNLINLQDGVSENIRTWRYIIGQIQNNKY